MDIFISFINAQNLMPHEFSCYAVYQCKIINFHTMLLAKIGNQQNISTLWIINIFPILWWIIGHVRVACTNLQWQPMALVVTVSLCVFVLLYFCSSYHFNYCLWSGKRGQILFTHVGTFTCIICKQSKVMYMYYIFLLLILLNLNQVSIW